jgi:hypothetical protein
VGPNRPKEGQGKSAKATSAKSTGTGCCASCRAATDRAIGSRTRGPILLNSRGRRMGRHAVTRRLHQLAEAAGIHATRAHPHMLRHKVTTMLDAGVDLRDVQIAARHADPRTTLRYQGPPEPAPPPELHPRRLHCLRDPTQLASPGPKLRETPGDPSALGRGQLRVLLLLARLVR